MSLKQLKVGTRVRFFNSSIDSGSCWHNGKIEQIDKDKDRLHPYNRRPIKIIIVRCDQNNMLYSVRRHGVMFI